MIARPLFRIRFLVLCLALASSPLLVAQENLPELEKGLQSVDAGASPARQRLAVRRLIRDAEKAIEAAGDKPERWPLLEFLFRARQELIKLDDDSRHRAAMLATCRELVKAPGEFAELRWRADLLLSQVDQAQEGDTPAARADALRPFVAHYLGTPAGPEALQTAIIMAFELGDSLLISDLRRTIEVQYGADRQLITFQREHFPREIFGAPLAGVLKRSDGKRMRFPMDVFGTSTFVLFWSREGEGLQHVRLLAEACKAAQGEMRGRLNVLSCNLDELADAGESIVRGHGMDWPCLHLPGGREHPFFKTYGGNDPFLLRLSATGQAAIGMGGRPTPQGGRQPQLREHAWLVPVQAMDRPGLRLPSAGDGGG